MPKWCVHFVGVNSRKNVAIPRISIMRLVVPVVLSPFASAHRIRPVHSSSTNMGKRRDMEPSTVCSRSVA